LAANGAVICSPKKSSTDCKAHWDICEMRYIRTPIIIIIIIQTFLYSMKVALSCAGLRCVNMFINVSSSVPSFFTPACEDSRELLKKVSD
jgi:hypothetical protein